MRYYAVGEKNLGASIIHGIDWKEDKKCHFNLFIKWHPVIHEIKVTPEMVRENFHSNELFKIFKNKEEASSYIDRTCSRASESSFVLAKNPLYLVEVDEVIVESKPEQTESLDEILRTNVGSVEVVFIDHQYRVVPRDHVTFVSASFSANGQVLEVDSDIPSARICLVM